MKWFILLIVLLAGCGPDDPHLRKVYDQNQVLILTDEQGHKYAATHLSYNTWKLRRIQSSEATESGGSQR